MTHEKQNSAQFENSSNKQMRLEVKYKTIGTKEKKIRRKYRGKNTQLNEQTQILCFSYICSRGLGLRNKKKKCSLNYQ